MDTTFKRKCLTALQGARKVFHVTDSRNNTVMPVETIRSVEGAQWLTEELDLRRYRIGLVECPDVERLRQYIRSMIPKLSGKHNIQLAFKVNDRNAFPPMNVDQLIDAIIESMLYVAEREGEANAIKALCSCVENSRIRIRAITVIPLRVMRVYNLDRRTSVIPLQRLPELQQLLVNVHSDSVVVFQQFASFNHIKSRLEHFAAIVKDFTSTTYFPETSAQEDCAETTQKIVRHVDHEGVNIAEIKALSLATGIPLRPEATWMLPAPAQLLMERTIAHAPGHESIPSTNDQPTIDGTSKSFRMARNVLRRILMNQSQYQEIHVPLAHWMRSAAGGHSLTDRIMGLSMSLEALYASGDASPSRKTLGYRCAWHVGKNYIERQRLFKLVTDFYSLRSKVVHGKIELKSGNKGTETLVRNVQQIVARALLDCGRLRRPKTPNEFEAMALGNKQWHKCEM